MRPGVDRGDRPLDGFTILLTRPEGRGAGLAARLERLGARVLIRPAIAFAPPADPEPGRRALEDPAGFDWIAFTSPAGVRFYVEASRGLPDPPHARARLAAVGSGTAAALRDAGLACDLIAGEARAEGLAAALGPRVRGARVLVIRPEEGRHVLAEELTRAGASVAHAILYRTIAAPEARRAAAEVAAGGIHAVVFGSPSAVRALLEAAPDPAALRAHLDAAAVIAIGEVTAAALCRHALKAAAIASAPTDEALAEALLTALRR